MGHSGLLRQLVNLVADTEELDFDVIYSSEGGGGVCGMLHIFMQTFYLFSLLGLKCCDMAVHIAKSQTIYSTTVVNSACFVLISRPASVILCCIAPIV
jgi:hypothetical protein